MDENTTNSGQKLPPKNKTTNKTLIKILVIVLVALVAIGGVYFWQNNKVKNLESQISDLKDKSKSQDEIILSQAAKISDLKNQDTEDKPVTKPVEEDTPGLKLTQVSGTRIGSMYGGKDYVAINVKVTNSGSAATQLDLKSFKLVDSSSNKYLSLRETQSSNSDYNYVVSILDLPKTGTLLTDQTLNKDETVAGILVFYAHNTISNFTLSYQGVNYPVTL